jgi:hypothetical protein
MAKPSSLASYRAPPLLSALVAWGIVAVGSPVLYRVLAIAYGGLDPVPPTRVWMGFWAVMAALGTIVGAVVFVAERSGGSWARSFAFTLMVATAAVPTIEDFAREPFGRFLATTVVVSLFTALVMGSIFHAFGSRKR